MHSNLLEKEHHRGVEVKEEEKNRFHRNHLQINWLGVSHVKFLVSFWILFILKFTSFLLFLFAQVFFCLIRCTSWLIFENFHPLLKLQPFTLVAREHLFDDSSIDISKTTKVRVCCACATRWISKKFTPLWAIWMISREVKSRIKISNC